MVTRSNLIQHGQKTKRCARNQETFVIVSDNDDAGGGGSGNWMRRA